MKSEVPSNARETYTQWRSEGPAGPATAGGACGAEGAHHGRSWSVTLDQGPMEQVVGGGPENRRYATDVILSMNSRNRDPERPGKYLEGPGEDLETTLNSRRSSCYNEYFVGAISTKTVLIRQFMVLRVFPTEHLCQKFRYLYELK